MSARGRFGALALAALLEACGGVASRGDPQPTEWSASRVREQWSEYEFGEPGAPECLTVWVIRGDGCAVSDDGSTPLECASAADPSMLNAVPDRFGTCIIGIEDCARWTCSE